MYTCNCRTGYNGTNCERKNVYCDFHTLCSQPMHTTLLMEITYFERALCLVFQWSTVAKRLLCVRTARRVRPSTLTETSPVNAYLAIREPYAKTVIIHSLPFLICQIKTVMSMNIIADDSSSRYRWMRVIAVRQQRHVRKPAEHVRVHLSRWLHRRRMPA